MSRVVGYAPWAPRAATRTVLAQVATVLDEYREQWPLTIRQVFYRLVGAHGFPKKEADYKRLQEYLNRGRRSGCVPWEAIRDDGGTSDDPSWQYTFGNPEFWYRQQQPDEFGYVLDPQTGQERFIEVWCEAGGMVPMLARAVGGQGIPVYSGGGFDSVTQLRLHARRHIRREKRESWRTLVLYVGDHDPSGTAMFHRNQADTQAFGSTAEFVQVAVLPEHITAYDLPTAPPKETDKRDVFTDTRTVQAEALPPDVLLDLLRDAVTDVWDPSATEAVLDAQRMARARIRVLREMVEELLDQLDDDDDDDEEVE